MKIIIPYKPMPYQRTFHEDISRFRIIVGGRRVGKTVAALQECIKHCLSESNRLCYWVAPTYHSAKEIGFDEFLRYAEILNPAIHSIHHTRLKIVFKNGSTLYFKGADNPDALRGRGLTFVVMDEAAFAKSSVWPKILRPALSDKKGRAVILSTANGFNWFKDLYDGSSGSKYKWPTTLNELITTEELLAVQADISRDEYKQEYLAEFVTKAGRVYDEFSGENIIPAQSPSTKTHNIYLGLDFGFAHHTAITFFAVERATDNKIFQFDEIYIQRCQIDDIINLIRVKLREHNLSQNDLECCFTDPAGNAEELSSGLSPVDSLRNAGFKIVNRGSSINAGIALVRSYIKNSLNQVRFFITENCKETIRSFNGYQYSSSKDGLVKEEALKDNLHDHLMDSVRYFFVNKFDHAKYVASIPNQSAYTNNVSLKVTKRCNKCHKPFISYTPANKPPFVCGNCLKE